MTATLKLALIAGALTLPALPAAAATITFEEVASGTVLSTQYAALGVTFSANAFTGANTNSTTQGWAPNSDVTVIASAANGGGTGTYGTPSLISGNVLHSYAGWLSETGDPSFLMTFATPISSISATFAAVGSTTTAPDSALFIYNGTTLLATVRGSTVGQFVLSYSAPSITSVAVAPGSYADYVAVDNITFTPASAVPEPATWAMMIGGFGLAGGAMRRRATKVAYA